MTWTLPGHTVGEFDVGYNRGPSHYSDDYHCSPRDMRKSKEMWLSLEDCRRDSWITRVHTRLGSEPTMLKVTGFSHHVELFRTDMAQTSNYRSYEWSATIKLGPSKSFHGDVYLDYPLQSIDRLKCIAMLISIQLIPETTNVLAIVTYGRRSSFLLLKPNANQRTYERIGLIISTTFLMEYEVDISVPQLSLKRTVIIE
jgi:hypothetical protein